mmetsp:Transcript_5445/g.9195  ORF Transcript_5445/g.9195 Transcript_5445/m.9195 type:complete len:146 (+) Transcript_5445:989-1426(+)
MNDFLIISKSVGLHNLFNVLQPVQHKSNDVLDLMQGADFDDQLLTQHTPYLVNVRRSALLNKDFRMNERIFRLNASAVPTDSFNKDDAFGVIQRQGKQIDQAHKLKYAVKSEVVHKLTVASLKEAALNPMQLAKSNFFKSHASQL